MHYSMHETLVNDLTLKMFIKHSELLSKLKKEGRQRKMRKPNAKNQHNKKTSATFKNLLN